MEAELGQLLLLRLRARNFRECSAVSAVHQSHDHLFKDCLRLERVNQDCRHHIGICIHDLASAIDEVVTEEALGTHPLNLSLISAAERCKTQLTSIQQLIGKRDRLSGSSDISGTVRDLMKSLQDQQDEMKTAKEELIRLYERISSLEAENMILKGEIENA